MFSLLTIRICLTIMAPALMEAVSETRLQLKLPNSPADYEEPVISGEVQHSSPIELNPRRKADKVSISASLQDPIVSSERKCGSLSYNVNLHSPPSVKLSKLNRSNSLTENPNHIQNGFNDRLYKDIKVNGDCTEQTKNNIMNKILHGFADTNHNDDISVSYDDTSRCNTDVALQSPDTEVISLGPKSTITQPHTCDKVSSTTNEFNLDFDELAGSTTFLASKPCSRQDLLNRYTNIERRMQHLVRRLRFMRTRNLDNHIRGQISSYVNSESTRLKSDLNSSCDKTNASDLLHDANAKNCSTSVLINFVKKLQTQMSPTRCKFNSINNIKGLRVENHSSNTTPELSPQFSPKAEFCEQGNEFCSVLGNYARHTVSSFDSDATDTSSGGESDEDILQPCHAVPQEKKLPNSLSSHSEWKWYSDRAAIISRWTWLQAQVSDLEYRIRQQTDLYKQIRLAKGNVVLGESCSMQVSRYCKTPSSDVETQSNVSADALSTVPSSLKSSACVKLSTYSPACNISNVLNNVSKQSSQLVQSLGNCLSPALCNTPKISSSDVASTTITHGKCPNGLVSNRLTVHRPSTPGHESLVDVSSISSTPDGSVASDHTLGSQSPIVDSTCHSARCRPIISYRKRKLLRTVGLHRRSHKAARLSSVSCQCYFPHTPCIMCSGRSNNTLTLDPVLMPFIDKVSLLDQSFHPVLSFKNDIHLSLYFDSLLHSGIWPANLVKIDKPKITGTKHKKFTSPLKNASSKTKRKYTKRSSKWLLAASNKIRKNLEKRSLLQRKISRIHNDEINNTLSQDGLTKCKGEVVRRKKSGGSVVSTASSDSSGRHTSVTSPSSKDWRGAVSRRRSLGNNYDIDNIVIPYSMASATRVERLQYKEIDTPSWRELPESDVEHSAPDLDQTTTDADYEDCSEEAFIARHLIKQGLEQKRFQHTLKYRQRLAPRVPVQRFTSDSIITDIDSLDVSLEAPAHHTKHLKSELKDEDSVSTPVKSQNSYISQRTQRLSSNGSNLKSIEPWPRRVFPLDDETYQNILDEKKLIQDESADSVAPSTAVRNRRATSSRDHVSVSRSASPVPSLQSCEDLKDPEWSLLFM